jgi:CBS domain-containing protein
MAGHNIGALAVVDDTGKVTGVISERDYLNKVALLGKKSDETSVKEICTYGDNLISVSRGNPIDLCMEKMMRSDVRHLLVRNAKDDATIIGMISIKDIVKCTMAKNKAQLNRLESIVQYQNLGV